MASGGIVAAWWLFGCEGVVMDLVELGEVAKAMTPNKIAGLRRAASRPDGPNWMRRYAQERLEQNRIGAQIKNPGPMRRDPNFGAHIRASGRNARVRAERFGPTPNPTRLGTPMRPLP